MAKLAEEMKKAIVVRGKVAPATPSMPEGTFPTMKDTPSTTDPFYSASPFANFGAIGNILGDMSKGMGGMSGFFELITKLLGGLVQGFMQLLSGISKPELQPTQPGSAPGSAVPAAAQTSDISALFADRVGTLEKQFQQFQESATGFMSAAAPVLSQFGSLLGRAPSMTPAQQPERFFAATQARTQAPS